MSKNLVLLILILVTAIGGYVRFVGIGSTLAGLNVDEVAIGYDAYSILKTLKNMDGLFMPLSFPSLGDYKPPLYIYLTSIAIALFGLSEFSVRFASAFFGTMAIPIIYFLASKIFKSNIIGIFSAVFLAVSPWHIFYSRIVSESQVAMVLVMFGIYALIKFKEGNRLWGFLSAIFLAGSMYTYHSERLFLPIFLLIWAALNKDWLFINKRKVIPLLFTGIILSLPLAFDIFFGKGSTRAGQEGIYNDINFLRQVSVPQIDYYISFRPFFNFFSQEWILATFFAIRKYISFLQPDFLFFNSLPIVKSGLDGLGVMYVFQTPVFLIGAVKFLYIKSDSKYLLPVWFFVGLLPAALTLAEHHTIRTLVILPVLSIISGVGLLAILKWVIQFKNVFLKATLGLSFLLIIFGSLLQAFLMFKVHFPKQKADTFMVGNKEAVEWIIGNQNFREIVFDPRRLSDGQIIVSVPHLYYLFYTKYDPLLYQKQQNRVRIENLTVREINWPIERSKKGSLFIGSPFVIPEKDLEEAKIYKKILTPDGGVALLIVSPI